MPSHSSIHPSHSSFQLPASPPSLCDLPSGQTNHQLNHRHSQKLPSHPTRHRSSSSLSAFTHRLRSASYSALNSLPSTPSIFPLERRSFIQDATEFSKKKAILSIAFRKGLFVFCSVHGVVSTALIALTLVRGGWKAKRSTRQTRRGALALAVLEIVRQSSTVRLASWLGLFSSLWTLSYSFLRKHKGRYAPWNAFLAGSLSGISLLAQTKADRREIAPNVFCRGLYSILMCHPLCKLKYGDMLLFALSNAQMTIAFILYPSTLPRWYFNWIARVGELNLRFVDLNRQMDRAQVPPRADWRAAHARLIHQDTCPRTWHNELRVQRWLNGPDATTRRGAPCALNHYGHDSCLVFNLFAILRTVKKMGPTYAILHLVPALIFRSKVLLNSPLTFMTSMVKKTIASALFLGTFASVAQNCFCVPSQLYERFGLVVRGSVLYGLIGFCTGLGLLWEEPKRRGELALYCAPKALYSVWAVLKAKKVVWNVVGGDVLVGAVGSGMLMHCFVHQSEKMPALARGMISQVVDPHMPGRMKKGIGGGGGGRKKSDGGSYVGDVKEAIKSGGR